MHLFSTAHIEIPDRATLQMHQLLQPECRRCFSAPNFVNASNGTTHIHGWSRKVGCKFLANVGFKGKDAGRVSGGGPGRNPRNLPVPRPTVNPTPPLRQKTWKRLTGLCLSFPLNMLTLSFQSKNIQIKERHGYGNFVILIEKVAKFILARCCPRLFLQESPP